MTESKIPTDEAISRTSTTSTRHGETIQTLKKTLEAFPLPGNTQFNTLRDETQQELRNLESKLTAAIAAKSALWSEISSNVQSLHQGLAELKQLYQSRPTNPSRLSSDLQHNFLDSDHHNAQPTQAIHNTIVPRPSRHFQPFLENLLIDHDSFYYGWLNTPEPSISGLLTLYFREFLNF
ncbi:unnamed protein product [Rotaria socialis]|uniref:Uncharacterized protein n=1 Tax=Rotaria socialis TaxID=392032 RepID=A0A817Z2W5_9BILA|nr:unnamed protein product [Rotaria socialis]CAF3584752.1 unnamed protein product [Rotaria socialis]CAF4526589.1 unnamed protein product [Rotaria socialis]CAF4602108.1 unnamed protein product [Rotaria socialis]CAF4702695.1 unnamed protein product [Rotaria socialis]